MRMSGPCLDAADVQVLARFYERMLGWELKELGPRWGLVRPADGIGKIEIQYEPNHVPPTWPSRPGEPTMQLHLDVWVEDVAAGVAWAIECGAREAEHQPPNRDPSRLRILLDPAGHPFCLWS